MPWSQSRPSRDIVVPNPTAQLLHRGWDHEYLIKTYLWYTAPAYGINLKIDLDVMFPQGGVSKADYWVGYEGVDDDKQEWHVLEAKRDISQIVYSGDVDGPIEETLDERLPSPSEMELEPEYIAEPDIIFAGSDSEGRRDLIDEAYETAEIIVADEDAPDYVWSYSTFVESLKRGWRQAEQNDSVATLSMIRDRDDVSAPDARALVEAFVNAKDEYDLRDVDMDTVADAIDIAISEMDSDQGSAVGD